MVTVIYVHGTGVRDDEYQEAFRLIGKKFYSFPGVKVAPCLWGDTYGARLNANGSSIPTYDTARAIGEYEDDDNYTALWELLYSDPLCELRAINVDKNDKKEKAPFNPVEMSPGEKFEYEIRNHKYSSTFLRKLQDFGLDTVFDDALKSVINSQPFKAAVNFNPDALIEDYSIIARAITAKALKICEEQQKHLQILYDAVRRDDFVEILTSQFDGVVRSTFGALAKPFIYLAKTKFTNHAKRKRGAIMDKAYMFPGDVLLYQARGDDIREFIRSCIAKENFPVVLIAHSLGGIACVELLVQYHLHQVKLLVTIGSQAPFLYEINALTRLPYGNNLPEYFPEWLNIYNLRDFISYVGSDIFPGKITDFPISSRQPFPQSHNALSYLSNQDTWKSILPRIEEFHD